MRFGFGRTSAVWLLALACVPAALGASFTVTTVLDSPPGSNDTLADPITGPGRVQKTGPGRLALTGVNTYAGGTTLSGGILAVGADSALGAASSGLTFDGGGLELTGALVSARSVTFGAGGGTIDTSGFAGGLAGAVSGTGGLTKMGTGTLTLSGTVTYGGATSVGQGTLQLGNAMARLPAFGPVTVNTGATLDLNGFTQAIGNLGGGGTVQLGGATLGIGMAGSSSFAGSIAGAGTVVKWGEGTQTLTGVNTYSGATVVMGGTLALGASQRLPTATPVTILPNATLDLAGFTQTVGSLGGYGQVALGAGTLVAGGTGASTTYAGTLAGAGGSLVKVGGGTLTLTGASSYTGGTQVQGGAIAISADANLGAPAAPLALDSGTLVYAGNVESARPVAIGAGGGTVDTGGMTAVWGGAVTGAGTLDKVGAGTLRITGDGFAGPMAVHGGTLRVDGQEPSSAVTVGDGARLGGRGLVGQVTAQSGAVVGPGASIGTLAVAQDVHFTAGSTFEVETSAAGTSDVLQVAGRADLAGALKVLPEAGVYRFRTRYTVLTAQGGLSGTQFASLVTPDAGFTYRVEYEPEAVLLTLQRATAFGTVSSEHNAVVVGTTLDLLAGTDRVPNGLERAYDELLKLSGPSLEDGLRQLANEEKVTASSAVLASTQQMQYAVLGLLQSRRMAAQTRRARRDDAPVTQVRKKRKKVEVASKKHDARKPRAVPVTTSPIDQLGGMIVGALKPDPGGEVWAMAVGQFGRIEGTPGARQGDYDGGGVVFGRGWPVEDGLTAGLQGGYVGTDVRIRDTADRTKVQSYRLGAYASYDHAGDYVDATLQYTSNDHNGQRRIGIGALVALAEARYDGEELGAYVEGGHTFRHDGITLQPHVALQARELSDDAYSETGAGALDLAVARQTIDSFQSTLGVRAFGVEDAESGARLIPSLSLGWVHEFDSRARSLTAAFVSSPTTFVVNGSPAAEDALRVRAGATHVGPTGTEVDLSYAGELSRAAKAHVILATGLVHF